MVQLYNMQFRFECNQEFYQPQEPIDTASHVSGGADAFL